MTDPLHDPDEVRAHLVGAASAGTALTYSEMLAHLGYRFTRPKMRALCSTLGEVDAQARAKGEPELAVLVVRASDGLPGQGWWIGPQKGDYAGPWEGPKAREVIDRLQQEAFDYWAQHG
ncbi:ribose-phosphate pyrophosphokinase [Sphingomicrobium aestuariivivum]|uniref:ribose-phosphate pyrophosphokinase n=1 Tax=Sphingomicrobium aestuariivivum TaxID=1582356 RepID=UPI001FD6ED14|nr:ribose-phosphate pyrophosphokinase [Sphingomicrobium aestuariivivum]MCJ8191515.1 ribose-phosphate pyrophosphokinase [Sphingomicrobium aestuariivivum]